VIPTKLQGLCLLSSCSFKMEFQPVRQAPVDPGKQKIRVLFDKPARQRDWSVDEPISS
jgi:hypothetical protein